MSGQDQNREGLSDGCPYAPMDNEIAGLRFCRGVLGFKKVDSTNETARILAKSGKINPGTLVLADEQSAGRGRLGHTWYSAPGCGIYASLLLEPLVSAQKAPLITLAAGVAVHQALEPLLGEAAAELDLKWPNDVLWQGRKVSGILVETSVLQGEIKSMVMGIGINVGHAEFPEEIRERAVSLRQITSSSQPRHDILLKVLAKLDKVLAMLAAGEFEPVLAKWEAASSFARGRKVKFFEGSRPVLGVTQGLNEDGALVVRRHSGTETVVYGGEIFEY